MDISTFSTYLERLENTTKRLEITDILAELITALDVSEVQNGINLSLGYLTARYATKKFNIADKMMLRALEKTHPNVKTIEEEYGIQGDLGDVAYKFHKNRDVVETDINEAHRLLSEIADAEGTGSQDRKILLIMQLLSSVDALSAKYLVRIILGTTRLGFTELTVADALSKFLADDKSLKGHIESKYFSHPDIGLIAKIIKEEGVKGLEKINMEVGVPLLAQKAQRIGGIEETVEKIGDCWAEYKYDGLRAQLHMDKEERLEIKTLQTGLFQDVQEDNYLVKTFTRNLEDATHQHPDIIAAAKKQVNATSVILDGEAIGIDKKTGEFLPFQEIMQRKRKHAIKAMAHEIPLKYFVFDIMYLDGKPTIDLPLTERHALLEKIIIPGDTIQVAEVHRTDTVEGLAEYYEKAKELNLEGIMVKTPNDTYKAGARSYSWIKLKKADEKLLDDSIDATVLGYYYGKGERSKFGIGGFLIGIYSPDEEKFLTISKVGTGLKDEDWLYLKKEADKYATTQIPKDVEIPKTYIPDVITKPGIVVEIGADEMSVSKTHSAGYALRFPRLLNFRDDKLPDQITTLQEIKDLHALQRRGKQR